MTKQQIQISKELFDMAYQWGRVGIVTDFTCNTWLDKIEELLTPPPPGEDN